MARGPLPLAAMAIAFILAKDGLAFATGNTTNFFLPASQALPQPTGYFSSSLGNLLLARALGIDDVSRWMALHIVLMAAAIGLALLLVLLPGREGATRDRQGQAAMVLVLLASSALHTLPGSIGMYDPVTFAGGSLLVLGRSRVLRGLGLVVMCLGNPEQATLASVCLLVLSLHPAARHWRRTGIVAVGLSATWLVVMQAWLATGGAGSRIVVLPYLLGQSVSATLANPALVIWLWLGCGWLIVGALLAWSRGRDRWVVALALIIIPTLVTLVTVDGARVFGMVTLPAFLVAGGICWTYLSDVERIRRASAGAFLMLLVLLPASGAGWGWLGQVIGTPLVDLADALYRQLVAFA